MAGLIERRGVLLVGLAAVASHATVVGGGFIWLDHAHLVDGEALAQTTGWLAPWTGGFAGTGYYRPLMSLSLSLDQALGGSAWLFHAVTLAWHAAAAVALTVLARALGLAPRGAALAGVLFATHPAASLVAGAIAFRSEAMVAGALFTLAAAHLARRPALAAAAVAFAGLTKETGFALAPLIALALEGDRWLTHRRAATAGPFADSGRRALWAAEASAWVAVAGLRWAFAPHWRAAHPTLPLGDAVGTRLASLAKSAAFSTALTDRTVCDAFPVTPLLGGAALVGALVFAALSLLALRRRGPALLLWLAVLPSLQLVPVMRWWSGHYVYLALGFAAVLLAQAAAQRPRATLALFAVAVVFAGVSLHDGQRFKSDERLWERELALHPECREGAFYLAEVHRAARRWEEAAALYQRALTDVPQVLAYADLTAASTNLGAVRVEQGRFVEAQAAFRAALTGAPSELRRRHLRHNIAAAALMAQQPEVADRELEEETQRADALPQSLFLRAHALHALGREAEAQQLKRRFEALKATTAGAR